MHVSHTLLDLAHYLKGSLRGNPQTSLHNVASLVRATGQDISYFNNGMPLSLLQQTKAAAVVLHHSYADFSPTNCLIVSNPLMGFQRIKKLFNSDFCCDDTSGIHASAVIAASASIAKKVRIAAGVSIGENVVIAENVTIGANSTIERDVIIGENSQIASQVSLHAQTRIGTGCIIESGVVIGAKPYDSVKEKGAWLNSSPLGTVVIGNNVVIGANTVIARGALGDTCIADGCRIDNLVHLAHDAIIGPHSALAGCAVIGAFAQIGAHCIIGGGSCIAPYVVLTDDITVTGMSTVNKSLSKSGVYSSGTMVSAHGQWRKNVARFKRLDNYVTRLIELEKKLLE